MQFQVPLFIDRESKIVGPLTFKQFMYIAIAGVIIVLMRLLGLPVLLFLALAVILIIAALMMSFLSVGGRSLPQTLTYLMTFFYDSTAFVMKRKELSASFM